MEIVTTQSILGKEFVVYGTIEEPLFLAKDVANWIEHTNARMMLNSVDDDEKQCVNNPYALKGQQEQWFLTEDGLYEVLMQSRKPIAKAFKKEVKIVLKSLRKHGMYATAPTIENILENPDYGIELLQKLKQERAEREALQLELLEATPKLDFYDTVQDSNRHWNVTEIAKKFGLKAQVLNKILAENGIQHKIGKTWHLRVGYEHLGRPFELVHNQGVKVSLKFNSEGYAFVIRHLLENGYKLVD